MPIWIITDSAVFEKSKRAQRKTHNDRQKHITIVHLVHRVSCKSDKKGGGVARPQTPYPTHTYKYIIINIVHVYHL